MYVPLFFLLLTFFFWACNDGGSAGTISDVDIEIAGIVTDINETPLMGTMLYLYKTASLDTISSDKVDSTRSDSVGAYHFDSLNNGIYHISANYKDSLFGSQRSILIDTMNFEVPPMRLQKPGVIRGRVLFDKSNRRGVLIYIPGTSFTAYTDSSGSFTMTGVAAANNYIVVVETYGHSPVVTYNVSVGEGDTTTLKPMNLTPNLYPMSVKAHYDPKSGAIHLLWDKMIRDDIEGYLLFRKDSSLTAQIPLQMNVKDLIEDTVYIDTLDQLLFSEKSLITFEYQVRGKSKREITPFSDPCFVKAVIERHPTDPKDLFVVSPKKSDTLQGMNTYEVRWNYRGLIEDIRLSFSAGGGTWFDVDSSFENNGSYEWLVPNLSSDSCRLRIMSADSSGIPYYSDLFSIKKTAGNIISNGDFAQGTLHWEHLVFYEKGAKSSYKMVDGEAHITVDVLPKEGYYVRLLQKGISIKKGAIYRVIFEAKASSPRIIGVCLQQGKDPWTIYSQRFITGDTLFRTDTIYMGVDSTEANTALVFDLGVDTGSIYFDNVKMEMVSGQ